MKDVIITEIPYKKKIDRSKIPDYMPPLAKEYEDGKVYTFHYQNFISSFSINAFSPTNNRVLRIIEKASLEIEKRKNRVSDSLNRVKRNKFMNEL